MNKNIMLSSALLAMVSLTGCKMEPNHIDTEILSLGSYKLQLSENQLHIWHDNEPEHFIWVSAQDGRLLSASHTDLDIKDSRSTYTIREKTTERCVVPEIQSVESGSGRISFTGSFKDCATTEFDLSFQLVDGQLQFNLSTNDEIYNHLSLSYESSADEHFYGFGEQFSYLDLKGQEIPVLTQEQGIGRGEPLLSTAINLYSPGSSGTTFTSYYAVPQYITNQRRSLYLEGVEYSRFDLKDENQVNVNHFGSEMVGRILYGSSMLDLIEGFTQFTGRMKALPDWLNEGAIIGLQGGTERVQSVWQQVKDAGTPVAALWLQDWVGKRTTLGGAGSQLWWNWELDEDRYPGWSSLVADLQNNNVRVMGYINPFLVDVTEKGNAQRNLYQEALDNDYLVKQSDGTPYPILITDFAAGIVDITNNTAREWLKDIIKSNLIGNGFSGWMADFGEALPFDAELSNGESGLTMHNQYPVEWAKLNAEAVAEAGRTDDITFFMRSGYTKSPMYSTLFWLGDQATTFDHYDGLKSAVIGLMNGGFSGISLNHSDIGGYTSLTMYGIGLKRSETLLMRWIEANAFSAVYRTHEGLAPDANKQVYSNDTTLGQFAKFAKVYAALAEYRKPLLMEAEQKGYPVVRHPILHYPNDSYFTAMDVKVFQFMLGEDFMIAPALEFSTTQREVHLPQGRWTHLWNGDEMVAPADGLTFIANAPIGQPPVYYRSDSAAAIEAVRKMSLAGVFD